MPESPTNLPEQQDPVVSSSLSLPLLISAVLLVIVVMWSLYDEMYGERPWKAYQEKFVKTYSAFIRKEIPKQAEQEKQIKTSPDYQKLDQELAAAEKAVEP